MKTFTKTFDGTGTDVWTLRGGNFFELVATSSPVTVSFYKNGTSVDETAEDVTQGFKVKLVDRHGHGATGFDEVRITSATAQTVSAAVSSGEGDIGQIFGTVNSITSVPTTITDHADVSVPTGAAALLLLAANANRVSALITADSANPNTCRVGGAGVLSNAGTPLQAGLTAAFDCTAAIYVYPGASTNVFHVQEIVK